MLSSKHVHIFILLFILASFTGTSAADVVNPGEKTISLSYQLTNIQDYPDYVFILHGTPNPSMEVLNSSEFNFYKLSTCSIYAVPRTVYDSVNLEQMNETQVEQFLNNDSRVARSNLQLDGIYGTVSDSNPLQSALITLKINSIQGNDLNIEKNSIIYSYENGQTEEKAFTNQDQTPEPSNPGSWMDYIYFIILPILALAAVIFILIRRRSN
ncbi:MAG: hypothetical protein A4E25_01349 [Methanobacterium sp. PtaB.Bin024]|jgi:hypothetical protein|nr:MAG: hypothetical protein A4E25_01349 [Methanobacterium sp. PtaB.Bin024]